ncbi:MAG: TIGR02147 family protein [Bdellovibrionales bacterium]|nr:TIGR02147 family protein [Bdellovibrionales bacterium]
MSRDHLPSAPDVFGFADYREFLKALYQHHKKTSMDFSYRRFSELAGFKSPNILKLVIDGKRNLTPRSSAKVARAFRLNEEQTQFFNGLVLVNQAKTAHERAKHAADLFRIETFRRLYPLKVAQHDIYANWFAIAIREMVASPAFKEDATWIAKQLYGAPDVEAIQAALDNLFKLGLLERDSKGRARQRETNITTGHEVDSGAVAAFHRQMIEMGSTSIDRFKRFEREVSASTLLVSEETFQKLKA